MKLSFEHLANAKQRLELVQDPSGLGDVPETLPGLVSKLINSLLSVVGIVFFALAIYGGFIWMKARGNEKEVERAKEIITNAVIGMVLVFAAYAISRFVITVVTQ